MSCVSALCAAAGHAMTGTAVENAINSSSDAVDWPEFMSRHDMLWDTITADPVEPAYDAGLWGGYYAGAIMGNGLLGDCAGRRNRHAR